MESLKRSNKSGTNSTAGKPVAVQCRTINTALRINSTEMYSRQDDWYMTLIQSLPAARFLVVHENTGCWYLYKLTNHFLLGYSKLDNAQRRDASIKKTLKQPNCNYYIKDFMGEARPDPLCAIMIKL